MRIPVLSGVLLARLTRSHGDELPTIALEICRCRSEWYSQPRTTAKVISRPNDSLLLKSFGEMSSPPCPVHRGCSLNDLGTATSLLVLPPWRQLARHVSPVRYIRGRIPHEEIGRAEVDLVLLHPGRADLHARVMCQAEDGPDDNILGFHVPVASSSISDAVTLGFGLIGELCPCQILSVAVFFTHTWCWANCARLLCSLCNDTVGLCEKKLRW